MLLALGLIEERAGHTGTRLQRFLWVQIFCSSSCCKQRKHKDYQFLLEYLYMQNVCILRC